MNKLILKYTLSAILALIVLFCGLYIMDHVNTLIGVLVVFTDILITFYMVITKFCDNLNL
nr:MAG TPA: hypothetical protein [Crassvirales sp.]